MKDRIEGTVKITPDQLKSLFRDYIQNEVVRCSSNEMVDIRVTQLHEYSDSTIEFTIRHEDDEEDADA